MPERKSKAPVSQLVNAEVNSGNLKAVLASNYASRIRGRHAALRECIIYKQLNNTQSNAKVECAFFWWFCVVTNRQKSVQFFFQEPPYFFSSRRVVAE